MSMETGCTYFPFHLLVLNWTTPQFEYLQVSVSEHQLFARTLAYAEQRLLLMAITVSLAVVHVSGRHSRHNQINDLLCAVHLRVLACFLLVSLIHCVPQVGNVPMGLH